MPATVSGGDSASGVGKKIIQKEDNSVFKYENYLVPKHLPEY